MSRVRKQDHRPHACIMPRGQGSVYLIEDSFSVGLMLQARLQAAVSARIHWFKTYAEASEALARDRPALAITGLNLPDANDGEILDLLAAQDVPTILFTTILNRHIRERFSSPNVLDYFIKDAPDAIDDIIRICDRVIRNTSIPVLVVDDKRSARLPLVELLRRRSYHVVEAATGKQALEILAQHDTIELVITDYQMPDMDGYELTQRIRAAYAPDKMRIIGISASSDPYLSASFLKAGASDFIYRPFNPEEVQCRIDNNIETLEQIRKLRYLAERDPLTGLYNRRAFFERAQGLLDGLRVRDGSGSVGILDIDHFKKVNDTYGHDTGDTVIKGVAGVLQDFAARGKFLTARFGGEEFVLLFADRQCNAVVEVCESIRQAIADLTVPYNDTSLQVTASIGVARVQHTEGMDNNLNAADQMLYMAKGAGRNQVFSDAVFYQA